MKRAAMSAMAIALWLPASMALAQSAGDSRAPVFDPAKSGVKVVFAPQKTQTPPPASAAGQRAHVDPQGKLKEADPEESQKLSDQMKARFSRSTPAVAPIYGRGGAVGLQLGEEYMEATVATLGPDGKFRVQCVPAKHSQPRPEGSAPVSKTTAKEAPDVR